MAYSAAFKPSGLTYALSVGATTTPATTPTGFAGGGNVARVVNSGATDVLIIFGIGVQTAVLPVTGAPPTGIAGTVVKAASVAYIDGVAGADSFAAIGSAAGPGIVYVQKGDGNGP